MGLFFRRRRPMLRLATGAVTAGIAYNAGRNRAEQGAVNEQATAAYEATEGAPQPPASYGPPPQYAPPAPSPAPATAPTSDNVAELEKLAQMHSSGALSDQEFSAAKAKLLGL